MNDVEVEFETGGTDSVPPLLMAEFDRVVDAEREDGVTDALGVDA